MRTKGGSLPEVLFGQVRGDILALLYGRTDESFYVRQIARHLRASVGAVQRELETLFKAGLVVRRKLGNQVFYKANQNNPIFGELRSVVAKTMGVFHLLGSALQPLAKRIAVAFVYGSMARQEETADSDVDVMIVGDVTLEEILVHLRDVELALSRPVNPTVYSRAEYKSKLKNNHFLKAVLHGQKIFLIGDEHELRKVGGAQLAKA